MRIIDLTDSYRVGFIRDHDRLAYENSFPELFEHYYRFWTSHKYALAIVSDSEMDVRKKWILEHVERLERTLNGRGIGHGFIDYVFFIGVGTTNGHAFKLKDKYYVWLPLETYTSEEQARIFVTHEIIHALHYHGSPGFYFESENDRIKLSRLLVTEGLATCLTREILGISDIEALWADFLDKSAAQNWWQDCCREELRLYKMLNDNYSGSEINSELFQANDQNDIFRFRAGYYAGLKLIEQYVQKGNLTFSELLGTPRDKLEKDVLSMIRDRL